MDTTLSGSDVSGDTAYDDTDRPDTSLPDTGSNNDAHTDVGGDVDTGDTSGFAPDDYTVTGPYTVKSTTASMDTGDECTMDYTLFSPEGTEPEVLVVLAHGFARGQAQMHGWAEHLASWGLAVATPQMCFLGGFNANHPANGRTLANLARGLANGNEVIVAGHSAGGLAATLAASEGGFAGLMALDPVDNAGLGLGVAPDLELPAAALLANPGNCNASGNGQAMFDPIPGRALYRMAGTTHCDYEHPTNWGCTTLCGGTASNAEAVNGAISALFTAFALQHGAGLAEAAAWWTPGQAPFDSIASLLTEL